MNDKKANISILGNSVAMRVRPVAEYPENLNYTALLRKEGYNVANLARGGNTVKKSLTYLDSYIRTFPEVYVLNFGVVDASTREVPKWFFDLYNSTSQYWDNRLARFIYNGLIKRFRRPLVYLRLKTPWVRSKTFKRSYSYLLDRLLKETNAIIIGLSINIADDRVEKALPGSRKNHLKYNQLIKEMLDIPRCYFIDTSAMDVERDYPDGVHFSVEGHEKITSRILETLGSANS